MVNRLRAIRAEKRVTQLNLALGCKMSPTRIWRIENGYHPPTEEERDTIARVLGVRQAEIWPVSQREQLAVDAGLDEPAETDRR